MDEIVKKKRRGKKKKIGGREAYLKGAPAVGQWLFAEDSFGEAERTEEEAERTEEEAKSWLGFSGSGRNGRVS